MAMTPAWLIEQLGMQPHPEGGHYVETFRDAPSGGDRGALTCIHFLLQAGEVSAWHRIDATEIWHFAAGDPLVLDAFGRWRRRPDRDVSAPDLDGGAVAPMSSIPPSCWQTAEPRLGRLDACASCIVAPAFDFFEGFEPRAGGLVADATSCQRQPG